MNEYKFSPVGRPEDVSIITIWDCKGIHLKVNTSITNETIPVRLPHFHLKGNALHFMISRRPTLNLSDEELEIWNAIDGESCLTELQGRFGDVASRCVQRFHDFRLCEIVPKCFPSNRRKVVIIEPHMDDAALSVGGTMWLLRDEVEFILVTMAGRSNFTSYYSLKRDFLNVDEVTALRREETAIFLRMIGGRHVPLDELDAPLRYQDGNWSLDWFQRHDKAIMAFSRHFSSEDELQAWNTSLARSLITLKPQEIWLNLGVGIHTDHEHTRNAFLHLLNDSPGLLENSVIRFYQDVPYAALFPQHTDDLISTLTKAGACLEREVSSIDKVMPEKLHLVSIFASQFKIEFIQQDVEACARSVAGREDGAGELFYRMLVPPTPINPIDLHVDRQVVIDLTEKLIPWLRRHRSAKLIRFVLLYAVGRWTDDMKYLISMFPNAVFEVHIRNDCIAETEYFQSPRISVHAVDDHYMNWLKRFVGIAVSRPGPIVILPGLERERLGKAISSLCFLSDSITTPIMGHFIMALRLAAEANRI